MRSDTDVLNVTNISCEVKGKRSTRASGDHLEAAEPEGGGGGGRGGDDDNRDERARNTHFPHHAPRQNMRLSPGFQLAQHEATPYFKSNY